MNTTQINHYDENGNENLDFWFGVRTNNNPVNLVTVKPQYVQYTMENLKKRSTKRLETMHNNMFGYIDNRQMMIKNLYGKLNYLWSEYRDFFKGTFFGSSNTESTGKRGRKAKFEENTIYQMLQDHFNGMKLVELAEKYNTNIATVSQTVNGKGTYRHYVNVRLVIRAAKNNRVQ